ncbi:hypothetical protein Hanom_Chr11g01063371 [Helianthus anomalus]
MKEIQSICNFNAYIKAFHPCKTNIIQIPIKTSSGRILINNDFFIFFITIANKTDDILMLILRKNLQLTQKLLFPLTKPCIKSLGNNGFKSITTIMKVSFIDIPKFSSANAILRMEVLGGKLYILNWNSRVLLVVFLSTMKHRIKYNH